MKLTQKTILITGGTSGIGLALARQLIAAGNTVVATGRDAGKIDAARKALPAMHVLQSDVSDPAAIATLFAEVIARFPALDVLINNAGIMRKLTLNEQHDLADLTREIEVNFIGPARMIQQFLPHLRTRDAALIVNVSSGLAFVPMAAAPIYSATKAAMHSYSQSLRIQLAGTNVAVVELAPPGTETQLFRGEFAAETKGMKAMDVDVLARKAIAGIEAGRLEIRPGQANALKVMSRVAPDFMARQLAKMSTPKP